MWQKWRDIEFIVFIAGLIVCLAFLVLWKIPLLNYLAQVGAVLAVILFSMKRKYLLLAAGAAGSLILGIWIYGFSVPLLATWALIILPGALMGIAVDLGRTPAGAFIPAVILAVLISQVIFWSEKDVLYEIIDMFSRYGHALVAISETSQNFQAEMGDNIDNIMSLLKRLVPSFIALYGVAQLLTGWLILSFLFWRFGEFFPNFGKFVYWKMPYYYIYFVGLILLFRLLGTDAIQLVADNLILFMGFFYAVFGFSVFEYYLKKIRLTLFLRILFYIGFILLQLPGLILAALVGLIDSYFDFRKVRARIIG